MMRDPCDRNRGSPTGSRKYDDAGLGRPNRKCRMSCFWKEMGAEMRLTRARKLSAVALLLVAATFMAPGRAFAQDRKVEISGGYSFLHEEDLSVPAGWYASGGGYLNNWIGIVGEVNGHYKTLSESRVDVKTSVHVFGAGPKFALRRNPRFTPYLQALFGGGRGSASAPGFDVTRSGFAYQPSAGVEINANASVGVRAEVARAAIHSEGEWSGETMFMVGVVIHR